MPSLAAGDRVGDYVIEHQLGRGGTASVYAARDAVIGKQVAIKVLTNDADSDPRGAERLRHEAQAIIKVAHSNIVDVFSFGELPNGGCYLVMEYLEGETLENRLNRGPVPVAEGARIFMEVVAALKAAHGKLFIHRDLKPSNIFLVGGTRVKLLDFGIAKMLGELTGGLTRTGMVVGTPLYLAPEQAEGGDIDHRVDIYALGAVMYETMLGMRPFAAPTPVEILSRHLHMLPPDPEAVWPETPTALRDLLLQMLAKIPADRPSLERIERVLQQLRDTIDPALVAPSIVGTLRFTDTPAARHTGRVTRRARLSRLWVVPLVLGIGYLLWERTQLQPQAPPIEAAQVVVTTPMPLPPPQETHEVAPPVTATAPAPEVHKKKSVTTLPRVFGYGQLTVTARPWVSVLVDGKQVANETPLQGYRIEQGKHRLTFRNRALAFEKDTVVQVPTDGAVRIFVDVQNGRVEVR